MTWTKEHKELIARAERIAGGDTSEHSAGFDGRLLEALRGYERAHHGPEEDAHGLMKRALDALARPPFDSVPRLSEFLMAAMLREKMKAELLDAAARALTTQLRLPRGKQPELSKTRALTISGRDTFPAKLRTFALAYAEPDEWTHFDALLPEANLGVEELVDLHRLVLERGVLSDARTHTALEALYTRSSWLGRRVLLSRLGHEHVDVLPALVSVAPRVDATTHVAAIEAMGRMGHVAAEPYLIHVLETKTDAAPMIAAAKALAELGTLASLPALRIAIDHDTGRTRDTERLELEAGRSIERLLERFPMEAAQGGLTLAEENTVSGALTLAGATEGDISLYETLRDKVASSAKTELATTSDADRRIASLSTEPFQRLVPGPRHVPTGFYITQYGRMPVGVGFLAWPLSAVLLWLAAGAAVEQWGIGVFMVVLMQILPAVVGLGWLRHYTEKRAELLTHGTPTYGQLDDLTVEIIKKGDTTVHRHTYTFKYMTEDQRIKSAERVFDYRMRKLEDDPFEPLLYHGSDVILFDEFVNLKVSEDGQLATGPIATPIYLIPPLIWLATLVMIILQYAGVIGFMF